MFAKLIGTCDVEILGDRLIRSGLVGTECSQGIRAVMSILFKQSFMKHFFN